MTTSELQVLCFHWIVVINLPIVEQDHCSVIRGRRDLVMLNNEEEKKKRKDSD